LDSLLEEDGTLAAVEAVAIKRVIAWQLQKIMTAGKITKTAMARRLGTSRSQLDRLLDPRNATVQLDTIARAAQAVGKKLRIEMVEVG
jgi:DNA-binding Xre family transcriptional regulator